MLNTTLILNDLVPALRSGEFQQADGQLRKEKESGELSHCCLGVACEVARRKGLLEIEWEGMSILVVSDSQSSRYDLPEKIQELYGFPGGEGIMTTIAGATRSLAGHNDHGQTFSEIADALVTYCTAYDEARSEVRNSIAHLLDN